MAILTSDIKLLKSAVMADTTDGGGQMTGNQVVDGVSNNLFPDTSALDRAFGRLNMRKVFGVAHTSNTDTLMGCHAIITSPPADPLVHCTLIKTNNWSDTRTAAKDLIEKYLVKGPRAGARIYDTHYQGSMQLRLISFVDAAFPAGGDGLVLRNPNGAEQFVRVLTTAVVTQNLALSEGGSTVVVQAKIATCELGQALNMDVLGPPAARTYANESLYALLYTTNNAVGAKFYGIKKLGLDASVDDLSVLTEGGIYTPVVPAATIETPIIDADPFDGRGVIADTSYGVVTMPSKVMLIGPNAVVYASGAIFPGSVSLSAGATTFTDANGVLLQGITPVGIVEYAQGKITFSSTVGSYGSLSVSLSFRAAGIASTPGFSSVLKITLANQGLSYTQNFQPLPAPGSFRLSYMAQGRWYDLNANLLGKLEGIDTSYGVGQISSTTGSLSLTLGAVPDVGSSLLASWASGTGFQPTPIADVPTKFTAEVSIALTASVSGAVITWARGATNYTATTNGAGVISGDATGKWAGNSNFKFTPNVFPDGGNITIALTPNTVTSAFTGFTVGVPPRTYVLADKTSDLHPGSVGGVATLVYSHPINVRFYDRAGILYFVDTRINSSAETALGTVDYTSGDLTFNATVPVVHSTYSITTSSGSGWEPTSQTIRTSNVTVNYVPTALVSVRYNDVGTIAAATTATVTIASWSLGVSNQGGETLVGAIMFSMGGELYSSNGGALRKGWDVTTGAPSVPSAGVATSDGTVTISSLPANGVNAITWHSFGQNMSVPDLDRGFFRTANAPLKAGVMQLLSGARVGNTSDAGVVSGDFGGTVDFARGLVGWNCSEFIAPATLRYNAVFLQYLPLDPVLLGIDTARLPLDGKVPIYRSGDLVVVHNTQEFTFPNPLTKGLTYDLGRERIASVRVKDVLGVVVPDTLYTTALNDGEITIPTGSVITGYSQPLTVEHRIEDMLLCTQADISGRLKFTRGLTHDFPADSSYVSSALPFGDLFARAHTYIEQATWTGVWADERIGASILPNFNEVDHPIVVTNRGAIKERWAIIFTGITAFRVIGEYVGEIAAGNTATDCAPVNGAVSAPYFTIPATGWGVGSWSVGNVLRFNTDAAGAALWPLRTVLQGPASLDSDQFSLAFRGDIDRP